jgi:hypothetical protein
MPGAGDAQAGFTMHGGREARAARQVTFDFAHRRLRVEDAFQAGDGILGCALDGDVQLMLARIRPDFHPSVRKHAAIEFGGGLLDSWRGSRNEESEQGGPIVRRMERQRENGGTAH